MERCKTCKHWGNDSAGIPIPAHHKCQSPKLRENDYTIDDKPDTLVYSYHEGGRFCTGPDFGCVHHEPKT